MVIGLVLDWDVDVEEEVDEFLGVLVYLVSMMMGSIEIVIVW